MKQANKERLTKFRDKNLELGRKRKEYYVTDSEHEAIKTKIKSLREKKDE